MSQREEFRWMMLRIKRMAEPWVSAIRSLAAKQNLTRRRRKKVSLLCVVQCVDRRLRHAGLVCMLCFRCRLGGVLLQNLRITAPLFTFSPCCFFTLLHQSDF